MNMKKKLAGRSCLCLLVGTLLLGACGDYEIVILEHDPDRAHAGYTFFLSMAHRSVICVDMDGEVAWEYTDPAAHEVGDFEVLDDGTVLYLTQGRRKIIDPLDDTLLYEDAPIGGHHSVTMTPHGTILFIASEWFEVDHDPWKPDNLLMGDVVREIDMETGDIVWEWRLRDYLDPVEHHNERDILVVNNGVRDWSHCNTVKYVPGYAFGGATYDAVLLNSRHLDTFWLIDHDTGDILWSLGQHGVFGRKEPPEEPLFAHAHEVERLWGDRFILFDNGNQRAVLQSRGLEIVVDPVARTAEEAWSWTDEGFFCWWGADANRLPNGNRLLVDSGKGRVFEVTAGGEVVWEMWMKHPLPGVYNTIYQAERIEYEDARLPPRD